MCCCFVNHQISPSCPAREIPALERQSILQTRPRPKKDVPAVRERKCGASQTGTLTGSRRRVGILSIPRGASPINREPALHCRGPSPSSPRRLEMHQTPGWTGIAPVNPCSSSCTRSKVLSLVAGVDATVEADQRSKGGNEISVFARGVTGRMASRWVDGNLNPSAIVWMWLRGSTRRSN